jgi:hypothetical protein
MLNDAYSYRGSDYETYKRLLRLARQHWMRTKQKYWSDFVVKCVKNRSHFRLLNILQRKGKIWVNYAPVTTNRQKFPEIVDNVD